MKVGRIVLPPVAIEPENLASQLLKGGATPKPPEAKPEEKLRELTKEVEELRAENKRLRGTK